MVKNSQPKFQSVYDYLVRGIESGFYRPETRFPSERKLAEKLNVNVATVRRAFRDLITSGVVEKRVGDGTYLTRGGGTANGAEYVNIVLSN
ncbi:MAG: winged helix-turn-helix transcriptional regulator [Lentisphaeria bacterium]|nr:winged helix-turn-helix transcriptional regulator [Lentisphaeria bacterium]